jgi:hypothetical protein
MSRLFSLFVLIALVPAAVTAQQLQPARSGRPYRGLFAPGDAEDVAQTLVASVTAGAGYDNDLLADTRGSFTPSHRGGAVPGGVLQTVSADLDFRDNGDRLSYTVGTGTTLRRYPSASSQILAAIQAHASMSAQVAARTTVIADGTAMHRPYANASLFGDGAVLTGDELQPTDLSSAPAFRTYTGYLTTVGINHHLQQHLLVDALYSYRSLISTTSGFGVNTSTTSGGITYDIANGVGVRLGYRYREARYDDGHVYANHQITSGLALSRALSLSRRTTVSFNAGATAVGVDKQTYKLIGDARLDHEIGRTWIGSLGYSRSVRFVEAWREPLLLDSLVGELAGLVNRRLEVFVMTRYAGGNVGVTGTALNTFRFAQGVTGATYGLSRTIAVAVQYMYLDYMFGDAVVLPPGWSHSSRRQSVVASIRLWAPLFVRRTH